jgi:putative sugar O-methyltransferase
VKNIIPQILTKELGSEPFHNYSPCPELYKGIMKTLFEKYYIEAGSSVVTSSHWKEFGDKTTINKNNDFYLLKGFGLGTFRKKNIVNIIRYIPEGILIRNLLRENNPNPKTVNEVNKILKSWNVIFSFDHLKNLLSFDLINSQRLFNQTGYICIIGDGYAFLGTLVKMIHPKTKIIFINLGKILPFDIWYFSRIFPEIEPLHLQSYKDVNAIQRHSVIFLEAEQCELMRNLPISLFINIASMGEMDMPTIQKYFEYMRTSTVESYFYCCNREEKKMQSGIIRFSDYPWDVRDKKIIDELCPWYQKFPISKPPFWRHFPPIRHRLIKFNK